MGRLFIRNIEIPTTSDLGVSANFLIADIRTPDKRQTDFVKQVIIPGCDVVNSIVQHIYDPNSLLSTFNPNKKESCVYLTEDNEIIKGDIQFNRCNVDKESGKVLYECTVYGRNSNVFFTIGDKFLTGNTSSADDLDFSTYDHLLSRTNVTNSWATSNKVAGVDTALIAGTGYRYGLIDYGKNNGNLSEYHVKDLRPQIFLWEILQKIFSKAGYTISSTTLNTAFFKTIAFPSTEENIKLSSATLNNSQFYARRNATQTLTPRVVPGTGTGWYNNGYYPVDVVLFNEDNVLPYNDAGGVYGTGTGWFIAPLTKTYNITAIINYDIVLTNDTGTATNAVLNSLAIDVRISRFAGTWIPQSNNFYYYNSTVMPTLTLSGQISCSLNQAVTAGQVYRVEVTYYNVSFNLYDAGAAPVNTGNSTINMLIKRDSQFYASLQDTIISEGAPLEVNQCLPLLTKQKDIVRDVIKMFNLYFEPSKTVENEIVIETYESFFTGATLDWTRKRDISKGEVISPMGILDAKIYRSTFKKDEDYWNKLYYDNYKESYGTARFDVDNDFVKNENVTEVLFSPTPLIGNATNGLIIPKFWKQDNNQIKGLKVNPRLLIYSGVINMSYGTWTLKSASGDLTYTTYPYVGHLDNPYNPTFDLNFDNPKTVYYSSPNFLYVDNNLFNKYAKGQLNQITSKQSKVVSRWYNLSPLDIKTFSFRSKIFDEGQYYLVNQIKNYDPSIPKTTEVELLLLIDFSPHVSNAQEIEVNTNPIETARQLSVRSAIEEQSNTSSGYRLTAAIAPVTSDVITADIVLNRDYHNKIIYIDATLGNVTLLWDTATMNDVRIYIVRIDATVNLVYINDTDATVDFIGNAVPYDLGMVKYMALPITQKTIAAPTPSLLIFS